MVAMKRNVLGRKACLFGVIAFLAGAAGCGQSGPQGGAPGAAEVGVVTVATEPVELSTELPGRIVPFLIAEIRPRVNGLVLKRLFTEGADVKAGDMLYQIDPEPFKASLDNARAAMERAQANLPALRLKAERYRDALSDRAVSQQDLDDAQAALRQTEADIQFYKAMKDTAEINLGYTRITAPITGRIGRSSVTDGAIVTAYQGAALATIQQLDPIYVDIQQSTRDVLRLRRSLADGRLVHEAKNQDKVRLILEDGSAYPAEGTLQFQDISVEQTTGSVTLRAIFPNPKGDLLPGMFVRAMVIEGTLQQAILVPQQAVSRDQKGNPYSLAVDSGGAVVAKPLTVDRPIGSKWLVMSGLQAGDRVIVEGAQKVRPGAVVRAVEADPNGQATPQASAAGSAAAKN